MDDRIEKDLVRIVALSWAHGGRSALRFVLDQNEVCGLVVAFGVDKISNLAEVSIGHGSLNSDSFQLFVERPHQNYVLLDTLRVPVKAVLPVIPTALSGGLITMVRSTRGPVAPAGALLLKPETWSMLHNGNLKARVILKGDFILDGKGRAIDAEYLRAQLPTGDRPARAKWGIQGGVFESWFTIIRDSPASAEDPVDLNFATAKELQLLPTVGRSLAHRIVTSRQAHGRFRSVDDLKRVEGLRPTVVKSLSHKNLIVFGP